MKYCASCGTELVNGVCPTCKTRAAELPTPPAVDEIKVREAARTSEQTRIRELQATAEKFSQVAGIREMVEKHIKEDSTPDQFKAAVLQALGTLKPVIDTNLGLSQKEVSKFSFRKAILAVGDNDWRDAGYEREVSQATERLTGRKAQGCLVPMEVLSSPLAKRGVGDSLTTSTPSGGPGSNLIGTNLLSGSFIEMLRNRMVLQKLGVITLGGLVGDVAIPKMSGGATMYWIAKDGSVTSKSALEILQIALTPHTAGAYTEISRSLLKQTSLDVEGLVRLDLASCLAIGLDLAGIAGDGQSNAPKGILYTDNIGAVAMGTNGGAPTWPKIVELWSSVAIDNADFGNTSFLTNAAVIGKLMTTDKSSGGAGKFICEAFPDANGMTNVAGARCAVSNQVPSDLTKVGGTALSAMIFGNFQDCILAFWGGLDIIRDPYSLSTSGGLRIVMLQDVDVAIRHAQSFAASKDIVTT